jgi:small subunit ribosomal protein S9
MIATNLKFIMSSSASELKSAFSGLGRRKTSVARVILIPGTGAMVINQRPGEEYLQFNSQYINASKSPLTIMGLENNYDIYVNTHGGGLRGQADAIKLGVTRALCYSYRSSQTLGDNQLLKSLGLLTRDSRRKERKKYGLKKARKAPQFSKR